MAQPSFSVMPTALVSPQVSFGYAANPAAFGSAAFSSPSLAQMQDQAARAQADVNRMQGEIAKAQAAAVVMAQAQVQAAQAQAQAAQADVARLQGDLAKNPAAQAAAPQVAPPQAAAAQGGCAPKDLECRIAALEATTQRLVEISRALAAKMGQQ